MKKITFVSVFLLSMFFSVATAQTVDQNNTDETQASSCIDLSTKVFKYRSRDADTNGEVSVLQDYLSNKGFLTQGVSGFYGLKTVEAVKKFQKSNGLLMSGSVGFLTKKAIYNDTCTDQRLSDTSAVPAIKPESSSHISDSKKVTSSVSVTSGAKSSNDSLAGVKWGNDTYSLASKPDAKDKWRDKFGIKTLPEDSFVRVQFDKTSPNIDSVKKEKVEGITLAEYNIHSGYLVPGVKFNDLAVFWGKQIVISKKGTYEFSPRFGGGLVGARARVILDNKLIYNDVINDISKYTLTRPKVTVLLEEGRHDLEVEYISNGIPGFNLDIASTDEINERQNSSTTLAIPTGSTIHYVVVDKPVTTKVRVTLASGFSPEYLILRSSDPHVDWEFSGNVSSIKGVITGSTISNVLGLNKNTMIGYGDDTRNYIPLIRSLDYTCEKSRVMPNPPSYPNSSSTVPAYCPEYSSHRELLLYAKKFSYTLGSFTSSSGGKDKLVLPVKTYTSNDDFKTYYENIIKKAKEAVGI